MKATGIVRRIDDLGRVVIPKEIRRMMRLKEGDPLEIFVNEDGVTFKKYSQMECAKEYAQDCADSLYETTGHKCIITDDDSIIAIAGFPNGKVFLGETKIRVDEIIENNNYFNASASIVTEGDIIGMIHIADDKEITNSNTLLIHSMARFLGKLCK